MAGEGHGIVQIPWYSTLFRGDRFEEALLEIAPLALRYGASSWRAYRSREDPYKFLQEAAFESKLDFDRYWEGDDFVDWRVRHGSWFQVPIYPTWLSLLGSGPEVAAPVTEAVSPAGQ